GCPPLQGQRPWHSGGDATEDLRAVYSCRAALGQPWGGKPWHRSHAGKATCGVAWGTDLCRERRPRYRKRILGAAAPGTCPPGATLCSRNETCAYIAALALHRPRRRQL